MIPLDETLAEQRKANGRGEPTPRLTAVEALARLVLFWLYLGSFFCYLAAIPVAIILVIGIVRLFQGPRPWPP